MRLCMLAALLAGLIVHAGAQTISIVDRETGEPVDFVSITDVASRETIRTEDDGRADISAFAGSGELQISRFGYNALTMRFDEIEAASFLLQLAPLNFSLDEVVVSATRWKQSSAESPQKVVAIDPAEVEIQQPQTAADLLGVSKKVFIQKSQQGGGSPMIRGFATNRLLYVVDGVRMNTAIFRAGNIQNVISLDPHAIERTEVFFGPGSVVYGSDAIGGVMSFTTRTPHASGADSLTTAGGAAFRYSSANDERTGHFEAALGWNKWSSVTSISSSDFGDLAMGRHGPDEYLRPFYVERIDTLDVTVTNQVQTIQTPSGYSQINLMEKLRFTPDQRWDLQYGFHYSETSEYDRYDRHIRYRDGQPTYGEWYYGPQLWVMNNLSIERSGIGGLFDRGSLRLAQQHFEESRIDRDINDPERHRRLEEVEAYSLNLDFAGRLGGGSLFYGVELVHNDVASTGIDEDIMAGTSEPGPSRYPQSDWDSYGIYATAHVPLSGTLMLHAGLRYNQFLLDARFDTTFYPFPYTTASIDDGALTGSAGLVFRPEASWVISVNAGSAFRAPNVDDMGKVFDSSPGTVVVPNPDLKAEYAYSADLGVAKIFDDAVKIDLTGYATYLDNAMVRRDYTINGIDSIFYDGELSQVQAVQNAAFAEVFGIQAGVEWKIPGGFGFTADVNYQHGEEELDDGTRSPSRHAPPVFGSAGATFHSGPLALELLGVFNGSKSYSELPEEEKGKPEIYATDPDGNPHSPDWYSLNFKARYRLTTFLALTAGVENLTDRRYRPFSSGMTGPGRNFILAFGASF